MDVPSLFNFLLNTKWLPKLQRHKTKTEHIKGWEYQHFALTCLMIRKFAWRIHKN